MKVLNRPLESYFIVLKDIDPIRVESTLNHNRSPWQYNIESQLPDVYCFINIDEFRKYVMSAIDGSTYVETDEPMITYPEGIEVLLKMNVKSMNSLCVPIETYPATLCQTTKRGGSI